MLLQHYETHDMGDIFQTQHRLRNWPTNVRPILERVSQSFVIFYFLYITIIVFVAGLNLDADKNSFQLWFSVTVCEASNLPCLSH